VTYAVGSPVFKSIFRVSVRLVWSGLVCFGVPASEAVKDFTKHPFEVKIYKSGDSTKPLIGSRKNVSYFVSEPVLNSTVLFHGPVSFEAIIHHRSY
jgi:hypothetical protein